MKEEKTQIRIHDRSKTEAHINLQRHTKRGESRTK